MSTAVQEYLEISVSPSGNVLTAAASALEEWMWAAPRGAWRDEPGGTESLLLALAAAGTAADMPPAWGYWRDFARSYITALCHLADASDKPPLPDMTQLDSLTDNVPPMPGGEYVTPVALTRLWERLDSRMRKEAEEYDDGVAGWLKARNPAWRLVGKVCFHLAENRKDPDHPFAFLATYSPRLSARGTAQHAPLANALREFADEKNREALLKLLSPVQLASEKSALAKELIDSGKVFHPQAWTPQTAYRFLKDIPAFEESGPNGTR